MKNSISRLFDDYLLTDSIGGGKNLLKGPPSIFISVAVKPIKAFFKSKLNNNYKKGFQKQSFLEKTFAFAKIVVI